MIVELRPAGFFCDREALALWLGRSANTIRKHCTVADRTRRGTPLYNFDHVEHVLARIPERPGARLTPAPGRLPSRS